MFVAVKDVFASLTIGFVKSLCYILLHRVETSFHRNSIRNDLRARLEAALITFLIIIPQTFHEFLLNEIGARWTPDSFW